MNHALRTRLRACARTQAELDVAFVAMLELTQRLSWDVAGTLGVEDVRTPIDHAVATIEGLRLGWAFRDREEAYDREPGAGQAMPRTHAGYRSHPHDVEAHCYECGAPEGRDCSPHCDLWE